MNLGEGPVHVCEELQLQPGRFSRYHSTARAMSASAERRT
jgi:hypothetical protein